MQHLGADTELVQVLRDILATMPLEERLRGLAPEERLRGLAPEERLEGLSPEEVLKALPPEDRERLRELLQGQTRADNSSPPGPKTS